MTLEPKPFIIAAWAMAGLLFIALLGAPHGYYQFLRLCVTVGSVACGYFSLRSGRHGWLVFFIAMALLFNPIAPVEMRRSDWLPFDLFAAGGMAFFAISLRHPQLWQTWWRTIAKVTIYVICTIGILVTAYFVLSPQRDDRPQPVAWEINSSPPEVRPSLDELVAQHYPAPPPPPPSAQKSFLELMEEHRISESLRSQGGTDEYQGDADLQNGNAVDEGFN